MTSKRVIILQHPSEQKAAKNTARLVKLVVPDCELWVGENPADFSEVITRMDSEAAQSIVLYPAKESQGLGQHSGKALVDVKNIIFLDGTWRKAYKLWQLNPWLHEVSAYHLETNRQNNYLIRKSSVEGSFSTLEAVAFSLNFIEDIDPQPLFDVFERRMQTFKNRGLSDTS